MMVQTGSRLLRAPQANIPDLAITQVQYVSLWKSLSSCSLSPRPLPSPFLPPVLPPHIPFEAGFHAAQADLKPQIPLLIPLRLLCPREDAQEHGTIPQPSPVCHSGEFPNSGLNFRGSIKLHHSSVTYPPPYLSFPFCSGPACGFWEHPCAFIYFMDH